MKKKKFKVNYLLLALFIALHQLVKLFIWFTDIFRYFGLHEDTELCDHNGGAWLLPESGRCWNCGKKIGKPTHKKYY